MDLRQRILDDLLRWKVGDPFQIEKGSMKEPDLEAILDQIIASGFSPIIGIHVGNFVGISLTYLAVRLFKEIGANFMIVAIDPGIPHRGFKNPASIVTKLLRIYCIEKFVLRIHGYSLDKCISNDGYNYTGDYDPKEHFEFEDASQFQLGNLLAILRERVHFIILDGNHVGDYLDREISVCRELLVNEGLLFLDDINENWPKIVETFYLRSASSGFEGYKIGSRIGVLRKVR